MTEPQDNPADLPTARRGDEADAGKIPLAGQQKLRWRSRGYIPHVDGSEVVQHIVFHLADSLPKARLLTMDQELMRVPEAQREQARRIHLEKCLDRGFGSRPFAKPEYANLMQDTLFFHDQQRYQLLAWVVMPNHVHALIEPASGWSLDRIVGSWKSFTGRRLAQVGFLSSTGRVWHREYWDRFMRDQAHYEATVSYIHENPVKAQLADSAGQWPWSSACLERQGLCGERAKE